MTVSDIPKGWSLERVSPPAQHKLPASDQYRDNYDRIFGGRSLTVEDRGDSDPEGKQCHAATKSVAGKSQPAPSTGSFPAEVTPADLDRLKAKFGDKVRHAK